MKSHKYCDTCGNITMIGNICIDMLWIKKQNKKEVAWHLNWISWRNGIIGECFEVKALVFFISDFKLSVHLYAVMFWWKVKCFAYILHLFLWGVGKVNYFIIAKHLHHLVGRAIKVQSANIKQYYFSKFKICGIFAWNHYVI